MTSRSAAALVLSTACVVQLSSFAADDVLTPSRGLYTNNIASDSFNLDLSKRRAAAVKTTLVKKYGIEGARLSTTGFCETRPKDTNDTLEARARNRRVELVRLP